MRKVISWCLFPLTMWYAIGMAVRNMLFNIGIIKHQDPPIATIGVGNICCGGTGKTPHVEYLLRLLGNDYHCALLSRGYRRKSKGYQENQTEMDTCQRVRLLGDEPAMVAQKFPNVQVSVCEKRADGLRRLAEGERKPQVVVLDDVYQHRHVKPHLNILLTEYRKPYYKDHVLPFGDLRESRKACRRADIIIVTKSPARLDPIEHRDIIAGLKIRRYQKLYFSYLRYGELTPINGVNPIGLKQVKKALVVTGIANPAPMLQHIRQYCTFEHMAFDDHHHFSEKDLAKIRKAYESLPEGSRILITTEKDAVRLMEPHCQAQLEGIPCYSLPIEVAFHNKNGESFDEAIRYRTQELVRWKQTLNTATQSVWQ